MDGNKVNASYSCQIDKTLVDRAWQAIRAVKRRTGSNPHYLLVSGDVCANLIESRNAWNSTSKVMIFEGVEVVCNSELPPGTAVPLLHPDDELLYGVQLREDIDLASKKTEAY